MRLRRAGRRAAVPALVGVAVLLLAGASQGWRPAFTVVPVAAAPASRTPPPIDLVGLGDSVTAGTNCGCTPFVQLTAVALAHSTGRVVRAVNDGKAGLDSDGLDADLVPGTVTARDVRTADVVLVTIGANDFQAALSAWPDCDRRCAEDGVPALAARLERTVDLIRGLRGGSRTAIVLTDYWNVFEDGDKAVADYGTDFQAWSDELTDDVNAAIRSAATASGVAFVDLKQPFRGSGSLDPTPLLAGDGDHPNAAGHELIAATLARALVQRHLLPEAHVTPSPAPG